MGKASAPVRGDTSTGDALASQRTAESTITNSDRRLLLCLHHTSARLLACSAEGPLTYCLRPLFMHAPVGCAALLRAVLERQMTLPWEHGPGWS